MLVGLGERTRTPDPLKRERVAGVDDGAN